MASLFEFFFGSDNSTTPATSRKRKRETLESTTGKGERERKNRRTEKEEDKPQGLFESVLGSMKSFFSTLTSQPEPESPVEYPTPMSHQKEPIPFKMPPKMLRTEPQPSRASFSLPRTNRVAQRTPLVEASPFVSPLLPYKVRGDRASERRTPVPSRDTAIYTSPFRFSYVPENRVRPIVNRTSPTLVHTSPGSERRTFIEKMEAIEQQSRWESMLTSISDNFEQRPEEKIFREEQQKYRKLMAQKAAGTEVEDLSFEYTEQKPKHRTVPLRDHDYERARAEERRRAQERMEEISSRSREPISWPKFPPLPTDPRRAEQDLDESYGIRALFESEEDEDWEQPREKESESEEESEVSGNEEYNQRVRGYYRSFYARGDRIGEDYDESDLEDLRDEFYDVDIDDVDLETIKKETALKRRMLQTVQRERERLHDYDESVIQRKERISSIQKDLRKLAKLQKKAERRRLEERRLREEEERRKKHIFSNEELALIHKTLKGRDNEVVISAYNADLKKSDIRRLRDTEWLNDEVINFYIELLKERNAKLGANAPRCHFFNTFFYPLLMDNGRYNYPRVRGWTRRVDIFAMDKVIVPVHMGNHWCLAVINFKDKRFEYYDSLGSSNNTCMKTLQKYLADESMDKKKTAIDLSDWDEYQPKDIPLQKNGYDCGVFMCKYADCVSAGRPFLFKQMHMRYFRQLMILEIVQKRCSTITF